MRKASGKLRKFVISNIKFYREKYGYSQEELSLAIGRKKGFIEKLENNEYKAEPRIDTVSAIADALNISVNWLLLGEKDERK